MSFPHLIYTYARRISVAAGLLLTVVATGKAQTIVANRVKAAAAALPNGSKVVAKYTDNRLHCLYYVDNNRLYKYDVLTNRNSDVRFSTDTYSHIEKTYVTENGKYIFICVDKDGEENTAETNDKELWRITPRHNTCKRIGTGFSVKKVEDMFIIRGYEEQKTSPSKRKTSAKTVKERHFSLDGEAKLLLQT